MEKTAWKVIAIVFIALFLIETGTFVYLLNLGLDIEQEELKCALDVCENYDAYIYDYINQICECYTDNELQKTEVFI